MNLSIGIERPLEFLAGDRRLTTRLISLWQGSRLGSEPFVRADLFLDSLAEDVLRDCCIVEITDNGECQLHRIGESLGHDSGLDCETTRAADLPSKSLLAMAVRRLKDACTFGAPILDEGEVQAESGKVMRFRSIVLPLCDDRGRTVHFLAAARYREKIAAT